MGRSALAPITLLLLAALALAPAPARAGLTITLADATIGTNSTGAVNIFVSSNSSDTLSQFNVELLITPVQGAKSILQFSMNQLPGAPTSPNYVFPVSTANDFGLPVFFPPTNAPSYNTITGGDSSDSAQGYVTLGKTSGVPTTYLLATVLVQSAFGASAGDKFTVSLVNDPGLTYFDDRSNAALGYTVAKSSTVTISPAALVPEPSSLALSLAGLLTFYPLAVLSGRRRRFRA